MIRECARPYSYRNYWLMQMLGKFGAKTKLYIFCPSPHVKKNVPTTLLYVGFKWSLPTSVFRTATLEIIDCNFKVIGTK